MSAAIGGREPVQRERRLAALASRQHGLVAHGQLRSLGYGAGAIRHRLRSRRIHRVHRGVYAVGHGGLPLEGRYLRRTLACGPGALLSHRSAAALWGLAPPPAGPIDVTVPRCRGSRPGMAVHRARALDPDDATERQAVPVATVARTLLDLAEVIDPRRLERAFEAAEQLELLDLRALDLLCERARGRRGLPAVHAQLAHSQPAADTRSELERRFLELCRRGDLPSPAHQRRRRRLRRRRALASGAPHRRDRRLRVSPRPLGV